MAAMLLTAGCFGEAGAAFRRAAAHNGHTREAQHASCDRDRVPKTNQSATAQFGGTHTYTDSIQTHTSHCQADKPGPHRQFPCWHQFLSADAASSIADEPLTFPPMAAEYRKCLHMLAERWGLRSESVSQQEAGTADEDARYTRVWLQPSAEAPLLALSDLRASRCTHCVSILKNNPD